MRELKIVTIKKEQANNTALIEALADRGVKVVFVGSAKEAMGKDVAVVGLGSSGRVTHLALEHMASVSVGLEIGKNLGLDPYKIRTPLEFTLTAPELLDVRPYLDEPRKDFCHQSPPRAKKHGNNRKRTKYRK